MRHAKSDWSVESNTDFERPLSIRGEKAARLMGKWLKKNYYEIERIICSPALRAKQTCHRIIKELGIAGNNVYWESEIYEASLNRLLAIISQHSKDVRTLLLIGHNPGLDQLLCYLSKTPPPITTSGKLLTTAALAILDYGNTPITTNPHQARLQNMIRPEALQV